MKHNFLKFNMNKLGVRRLAHLISKFSFSHVDLNMKKNKINYQRFCHKKFLKPMNHSILPMSALSNLSELFSQI